MCSTVAQLRERKREIRPFSLEPVAAQKDPYSAGAAAASFLFRVTSNSYPDPSPMEDFVSPRTVKLITAFIVLSITGLTGCAQKPISFPLDNRTETQSQRDRDEKTREEVAKATERVKPEVQWTVRKLSQAAETLAEEAVAAIQGLLEGWNRNTPASVNLNSASETELARLPGLTRQDARRIIQSRPYRDKRELVTKGILSDGEYRRIRDVTRVQ
jgi:DNA uptake protein ComE-like DNA-binding protein